MNARTSSTGILNRLLEPETVNWSADVAQAIVRLDFARHDHARVEELSNKAQVGTLSEAERGELDEYLRVADMLAVFQAKARTCLKRVAAPDASL